MPKEINYIALNYIALEETMNNLLSDTEIKKHREALVDFVKSRLNDVALSRLEEKGITQEMKNAFVDKKTSCDTIKALLERIQTAALELDISKRRLAEFRRNASIDGRASALKGLEEALLEKELILFRQNNKLSAKVWLSFLNCTVLPSQSTLETIKKGLKLDDSESKEFDSLVIQNVFDVDKALYDCVQAYLKQTGKNATDFSNDACISKDAWSAFSCSKDSSSVKKTSQGTLLKLTIGFDLNEDEAWDFMETAGSSFVVRRDLVFLACIHCQYHKPWEVDAALIRFNNDNYRQLCYENPYARSRYWDIDDVAAAK